jgi:hypothetical protein
MVTRWTQSAGRVAAGFQSDTVPKSNPGSSKISTIGSIAHKLAINTNSRGLSAVGRLFSIMLTIEVMSSRLAQIDEAAVFMTKHPEPAYSLFRTGQAKSMQ